MSAQAWQRRRMKRGLPIKLKRTACGCTVGRLFRRQYREPCLFHGGFPFVVERERDASDGRRQAHIARYWDDEDDES